MRRVCAGAIVVFIGMLAACGAHQHRKAGLEADHERIFSQAAPSEPMPGRFAHLGIAPTVLGVPGKADPGEEINETYEFPRGAFEKCLAEALRQSGAFETVALLEGEEDEDGDAPEFPGDGIILQMDLSSHSLQFIERNSNQALGLAIWFTGIGFPAQWVHDEVFRLEFYANASITDGGTERPLRQALDLGTCRAQESLNFHERTTSIWPYLLTNLIPPTVIGSDPEEVMRNMLGPAMREALPSLMEAFEEIAQSTPPDALQEIREEAHAVAFDFRTPRPGEACDPKSVDLDVELEFARGASDLIRITVNGGLVLDAARDRDRIPEGNVIRLQEKGVKFEDQRITIAVLLLSERDPVEVTLWNPLR